MHNWLRRIFPALLFLTISTFVAPGVFAQGTNSSLKIPGGGAVNVNAENFSRDLDKGVVEVSGNVQLIFNQQYMSCDRAVVNEKTQDIEAYGNFVLSSPQAYVEGDSAIINYKTNTGVIMKGYVKSGQVIFEGKVVRKTGPDTYEAENSAYTACTTCPTAWTFSGSRMSARVGGYAFIKNPILEIGSIPILWLPWLVVPLKTERQTGLLIPTFELNSDEFSLGTHFFWAISRSQDATFSLMTYSRRGLKGLVNYRYMLSSDSEGEANFGIMNDRQFSGFPAVQNVPGGPHERRWFLNYKHAYELPHEMYQRAKINLVSDLRYPLDYWLEMPGRGDPALENRFSLARNTTGTHTSIDATYFTNMLKETPLGDNKDAVHRWPEIRYAVTERRVLGSDLLFNFNANYVHFARDGYGYDDVKEVSGERVIDTSRNWKNGSGEQRGGIFNPTEDIVRTGQRLDVSPEVSYPFKIGRFLDILPAVQFRYTQYSFNVSTSPQDPTAYDPSPHRQFLRGKLSMRTSFYRIYGRSGAVSEKPLLKPSTTNWSDSENQIDLEKAAAKAPSKQVADVYRHEIQPEIQAGYVPYIVQPSDHPFFRQGALIPIFLEDQPLSNANFQRTDNAVQFDYYDRLSHRTLVTGLITNRIVRKRSLGSTPDYRQIVVFRAGQSYDFDEAKSKDRPLPKSDIFATLDARIDYLDLLSSVRYFPYHNVTNSTSSVRVKNFRQTNFAQVSYSQNFTITRNPDEVPKGPESVQLATGFISKYLDFAGALNYQPKINPEEKTWTDIKEFRLYSWETDMRFKPPGNCWGIKILYAQPIGGKALVRADFDFKFGG